MQVKLIAHSKLSEDFINELNEQLQEDLYYGKISDGQAIALSAIRTCYSHNYPSEILEKEGKKYFGSLATDGQGGTEADRLIRHIMNSGHLSTTEHLNFTFAIEGVSRSLLAQLTRHRHFSYSVQSQRYNKLETTSKSGGFDYTTPESIKEHDQTLDMYNIAMERIQEIYDGLRKYGIPAEDARYILPNAATCNLVLTGNLRSILEFYKKRSSNHAQIEIRELSEKIKDVIIKAEPWTESFFKI
jgi:thymidylate synthase (FAD)